MALNFPDSPADGAKFTDATTGETWTYEASTNSWTSDGLTTSAGIVYKGSIDITAAPPAGAASGWQYTVTTGGTANAGFTGLSGTVPVGTTVLFDGTNWQKAGAGVKWDRTGTALKPVNAGDTVQISAGTAALPGLTPVGDPDTGVWAPAADTVAVSTKGLQRATVDSSGRLLVGTPSSTADAIAVFLGRTSALGGTGGEIKLAHPATNAPSSGILGRIQFGNPGNAKGAEIWAIAESAWASNDYPSQLVFSTTPSGGAAPQTRMTIKSDGNVGIGTAAPALPLSVKADGNRNAIQIINGGSGTEEGRLYWYASDASTVRAGISGQENGLVFFGPSASEKARIDTSGNFLLGGTLPASPNISLNANGNATFAGSVNTGAGYSVPGKSGATVFAEGLINVRRNVDDASNVFAGYQLNGASPTSLINADGSATFKGSVVSGDGANNTSGTGGVVLNTGDTYFAGGNVAVYKNTDITNKDGVINYAWEGYARADGTANVMTLRSSISADGSAMFAGTVTATVVPPSDQKFKENITPASPQLADVVALGNQLKNFSWNADAPVNDEIRAQRQLGLIAQEAEKVCPSLVKTIKRTKQGKELTPKQVIPAVYEDRQDPQDEENFIQVEVTPEQVIPATYEVLDDSYKGISHDALIMKLLGAIAELEAKVTALESK